MSETSGFFQGMWDSSLMNPTTEEQTGWWDRSYLAKDFMEYFSLFVGNGVFASPTNQLKVVPGVGRTIIVSTGWAFINGGWYHNDTELALSVPANGSSTNRTDSVRIRYSASDRKISAVVVSGETGVTRGDTIWDLEIAQLLVTPGFTTIADMYITDMRPEESVCGFVTGLLEVVETSDLFSQFQGIFENWFDTVKGQVQGDLAIRLQQEFEELNTNVIEYKEATDQSIEEYKTATQSAIDAYQAEVKKSATDAQKLVTDYVEKDFLFPKRVLNFVGKVCTISDERITADTLVDVYFTAETMPAASKANIYVDSYDGRIELTAEITPTGTIEAIIRVRVK